MMTRWGSSLPLLLLCPLASLAVEGRASAAEPVASSSEQLLAQSLFDEGRTLMDRGRFAEACPKLAESQRLDPGGGTLLNLALCHEKEGKLGSAFLEMKAASSQAAKDGRKDREKIANEHVTSLGARVPKLAVHVAREEEGLEVHVDGTTLRKPAWDLMTVVDPGSHVVEAVAPGKAPFRKTITIAEAEQRVVQIPALDTTALASTVSTTSASFPFERDAGTQKPEQKTNPWFVASVATGIAGFAVGLPAAYVWGMLKLTQSTCKPIESASSSSTHVDSGSDSMFCTSPGVRDAWFAAAAVGLTVGVVGTLGIAVFPRKVDVGVTPVANGGATATLQGAF